MDLTVSLKNTIQKHDGDINSVKMAKNKIFSGSGDKDIRIFAQDSDGIKEMDYSPLKGHTYYVNVLSVCYSGQYLASGSTDSTIIIWSIANGDKITTLSHPTNTGIRSLQFSWNSKYLVSGSEDGSVCLWSLDMKWKLIKTISEHEGCCYCCIFTPDTELIVTGSSNGDLRFWDCRKLICDPLERNSFIYRSNAHDLGVLCGSMSPEFHIDSFYLSYQFVTCGGDDLVKIWILKVPRDMTKISKSSLVLHKTLKGHSRIVQSCEYSPDGLLIGSVSMDHMLIIWDVKSGSNLVTVQVDNNYVNSCSFSWNGDFIATGGNDKSIKVWSVHYKKPDVAGKLEEYCVVSSKEDFNDPKLKKDDMASINNDRVLLPVQSVQHWTCNQVVSYLVNQEQGQLGRYSQAFYHSSINGSGFLRLTEEELRNEFNIDVMGHRKMIMKIIEDLRHITYADDNIEATLPNEIFCPITHEIMRDPVIASDGITYERTAIQAWLSTNQFGRSPITNNPINNNQQLLPNLALRNIIMDLTK